MQVTRATFIPLLAPAHSDRMDPGVVREEYIGDLNVVYTFGPQFGRRVVTHADLEQMELSPRVLRRTALEHLEVLAGRAEFHGQPPALMLSFEGLESSLLLASDIWQRLEGAVPGELVVGVPTRDVVVVTGSNSTAGLEKARRCVERVFFAGDENLLTRTLLVRRGGTWEPFDRSAGPARPHRAAFGPHHRGPEQPPRQYQEHQSWPGERVPVARRPMQPGPLAPAAHMGMPHPTHTGSMPPVGPAGPMVHTGGMPPVGPAAMPPVGHTGMMPPVAFPPAHHTGAMSPVSHTGTMPAFTGAGAGAMPAAASAHAVPDVAPYSAVPYSAVPYSAIPYSAIPYSAIPNSASPYAPAPHAASEYLQSRGAQPKNRDTSYYPVSAVPHHPAQPDGYRSSMDDPRRDRVDEYRSDDFRSPGNDRGQAGYGGEAPAYPASWGEAPSAPTRLEFRSGPRARFTR